MCPLFVLCSVVLIVFIPKSHSFHFNTSPCHTSIDSDYGGMLTNCSGLGISELPIPGLPNNITTLILSNNNITRLSNGSFQGLSSLRRLYIRESNVAQIEEDALFGLGSLEILDLEGNDLPLHRDGRRTFPLGMFKHVSNLCHLFIGFNTQYMETTSKYANYLEVIDIFSSLPRLINISIDTVNDTLYLGPEFGSLKHLTSVAVVCNVISSIRNNSLEGLWLLRINDLKLLYFYEAVLTFEHGVFQNQPFLKHLTVWNLNVGNHQLLQTLGPLVNLTMESLVFLRTSFPETYGVPTHVLKDGIIDYEVAKSLRSICVTHFRWIDSILFAFEPGAITSGAWLECIQSIDLSKNKLENIGWLSTLLEFRKLKNLKELILSSSTSPPSSQFPRLVNFHIPDNWNDTGSDVNLLEDSPRIGTVNISNKSAGSNGEFIPSNDTEGNSNGHANHSDISMEVGKDHVDSITNSTITDGLDISTFDDTRKYIDGQSETQITNSSIRSMAVAMNLMKLPLYSPPKSQSPFSGNITVYFLPSVRKIKWIGMIFAPITYYNFTIVVKGANNFEEFYWINNDLLTATGVIYGLENLKVFDLTGSKFDVADNFFDNLYGLRVLILSSFGPDNVFNVISLERRIRNLTNLRYFDVSRNQLNSRLFPWTTFTTNPNMTHIILAQNRFSCIPFDLATTTKLRVLDLSGNAILFLTQSEMVALNKQAARVDNFVLKLQDNGIACVCSSVDLLVWIFTTPVTVEDQSEYTCQPEDGSVVLVRDLSDIPTFYRVCEGRFFLMASLVLAFITIGMFLSAFLIIRFRTALKSIFMNIVKAIKPITPNDYKIHVFIGYADNDYQFVVNILRRFLEDSLKYKTFIHQRDPPAGEYRDQQFLAAMQESWRILLVLSSSFLNYYDMGVIVMKYASHSVTPVNPKRVFVLVEECQVFNIPNYLSEVLDDSQIIILPNLREQLDYRLQQSIKECMRAPY